MSGEPIPAQGQTATIENSVLPPPVQIESKPQQAGLARRLVSRLTRAKTPEAGLKNLADQDEVALPQADVPEQQEVEESPRGHGMDTGEDSRKIDPLDQQPRQDKTNRAESEEVDKLGVKDEWFGTLVSANGFLPQANFVINLSVLESVVNNPPADWESFRQSELSDEQVRKIGHLMTNMHRARGIRVADPNVPDKRSQESVGSGRLPETAVDDDRLRDLWRSTRNRVYAEVLKRAQLIDQDYQATGKINPRLQSLRMNEFFEEFIHSEDLAEYQAVITTAKGFLSLPRAEELARIYKLTYDERTSLGDRMLTNPELAGYMERNQFTGSSRAEEIRNDIQIEIMQLVHDGLKEQQPDLDPNSILSFRR